MPAPHVVAGDNCKFRAVSMVKWPGDPVDWVVRAKYPWQTYIEPVPGQLLTLAECVVWRGDNPVEDTLVPSIGGWCHQERPYEHVPTSWGSCEDRQAALLRLAHRLLAHSWFMRCESGVSARC